ALESESEQSGMSDTHPYQSHSSTVTDRFVVHFFITDQKNSALQQQVTFYQDAFLLRIYPDAIAIPGRCRHIVSFHNLSNKIRFQANTACSACAPKTRP